jgi:hypothetical protein
LSFRTASEIKIRFIEEQENVEDYIRFLEYKTSVLNSDLQKIRQLLEKYGFLDSKSKIYDLLSKEDEANESEILYDEICKIRPQIDKKLLKINDSIEKLNYPEKLNTVDVRTELGDLILCIKEQLKEDKTIDIENFKKENIKRLKPQENELRLDLYHINSIKDVESAVTYAIESANYLIKNDEYNDLMFICGKLKQIDIMMKMSKKDNQLSIVRQGFILLMTIFDSTIFDLMRIALNNNFFELISIFGKNDKIALDAFKDYNSLDNFKESIIEEQLQKKYIKDILFILKKLNVKLVIENSDNQFAKLIELILRRNIHIHNLGIVDEKYLEKKKNDSPAFNIYRFNLGEYAKIDNKYWEEANRLCRNCVLGTVNWISDDNCKINITA